MRLNEVNKITGSRWLQSEVQAIEGEIAHAHISPRKYQLLSKRLDHVLKTIHGLEAKDKTASVFARVLMDNLKERVVKGCGDLVNALVKREISQIQEESTSLITSLRQGRPTLKALQQLERHIQELKRNHLTSIPERRIIAEAEQVLLEAKEKLKGKQPPVRHFDWLAGQQNVRSVEENELFPGEVEELYDIARAVYNRDLRQAKMRYATLPNDHKRRFETHMQNLMASPFVDALETMQAMIATANELARNGETYPSSDQIDQLFLGLSHVNAEESGTGKLYTFNPRESFGG